MTELGKILYNYRVRRRLSQGQLAEYTKIPQPRISETEKGYREDTIRVWELVALSIALKVPFTHLLAEAGYPVSAGKVMELTEDEVTLIDLYREVSVDQRDVHLTVLKMECNALVRKCVDQVWPLSEERQEAIVEEIERILKALRGD